MFYSKNILLPGVYIINPNFGATNNNSGMQGAPIYSSIPNFSVLRMDQNGERVIVMPGFKFELWPANDYSGTSVVVDNTNGTKILFARTGISNGSSCKIYFNNVLIPYSYSSTGV